jgi:hypothetical protein
MTSRTDIAISLARAANPVEPDPNRSAWADAEGRAAFERIVASPVADPTPAPRLRPTRRRLALGVGLAAAAGAAVAVVGLPGSPNHGGAPAAAAWAVTKNPDGSVSVNIRDYRDPAGLQAKLRAAGVRANVTTAPDKCLVRGGGTADEFANFGGDTSTFHTPYTWQRLFAGSPSYVTNGPGYSIVLNSDGQPVTLPNGETFPAHLSFTVHPNQLPPGDDLNIGFVSGRAMLVDVEKTGTPLQCSTPQVTTPPDDGSTPTS